MYSRFLYSFYIKLGVLFFILFCKGLSLHAQFSSPLEERLFLDIEDNRLDEYTRIEAAWILSGVNTGDSLKYYHSWYNHLVEKIRSFHFDVFDPVGSASKLFHYLHATWLRQYQKAATTLLDIVHKKTYNCVSATVFYNLICDELGWKTEAFETPTHVYTIFSHFTERVMVENTSPMGFNIIKNLRAYSQHLAQYYPENQVVKIGLDRLYAYENSKGRIIDNTELLGLLAYNRAYLTRKRGDYEKAYYFVLQAQNFNRDSRSNVNFEIGLYYDWGKKLFEAGRFAEAFEVSADGFYRYPDMKDFKQNTRSSFFRAVQICWEKRDWNTCRKMSDEMLELEVLEDTDFLRLQHFFEKWATYFYHQSMQKEALEAVGYCISLNPNNPKWKVMRESFLKLPVSGE